MYNLHIGIFEALVQQFSKCCVRFDRENLLHAFPEFLCENACAGADLQHYVTMMEICVLYDVMQNQIIDQDVLIG